MGDPWYVVVDFRELRPENDRSVATLDAFESPATDQRNPIAGGGPLRRWTTMTGTLSHPVMTSSVRSRERNLLRSPSRALPSAPQGLLRTTPGYAAWVRKAAPFRSRSDHRLRRFPMRPDGQSGTPARFIDAPSPQRVRYESARIRTRLSGALRPPEPSDATDGVHATGTALPCAIRTRLCLLPGPGSGRPFACRSPPMVVIIMRSDTANNLVGY